MYLEIVTPETTLFNGEVKSVTVPGLHGSFEMLNDHGFPPVAKPLNWEPASDSLGGGSGSSRRGSGTCGSCQ